jgi:hypothetical protein
MLQMGFNLPYIVKIQWVILPIEILEKQPIIQGLTQFQKKVGKEPVEKPVPILWLE